MSTVSIGSASPQKQIGLIHKVYLIELKNARKYTASTKTKSEVRGGGRKPWKQKGTGNARAGSSRSPLWAGGGVTFGPKPRIVSKKINKKERLAAVNALFSLKKDNVRVIDLSVFKAGEFIKTKALQKLLLGDERKEFCKHALIVLEKPNRALWLASQNLKGIEIVLRSCLNIRQALNAEVLFMEAQTYSNLSTFIPVCAA